MDTKGRVTRLAATSLALALTALGAAPPAFGQVGAPGERPRPSPLQQRQIESPRSTPPTTPLLRIEQVTKEQFERLPDDQVIDVQGKRVTVGELRARMRQQIVETEAKVKALAVQAEAEFQARRSQFLQQQKAKLDAENVKVEAMAARLRQQGGTPGQQMAPPTKGLQQPQRPEQLPQPPLKAPRRPGPVWK